MAVLTYNDNQRTVFRCTCSCIIYGTEQELDLLASLPLCTLLFDTYLPRFPSALCPVGVSQHQQQFSNIKGNIILVLMHINIVNGHTLLCDAHTVVEQHIGNILLTIVLSR